MEFIIKCGQLLKPLKQVSHLSSGGRRILPILENLLLQVTENTLSLTGSDLEIEIVAHIALSQPYNVGQTTISARKFFDICRSLPEWAEITVKLIGDRVLVQSSSSHFFLSSLPAANFPSLDNWQSQIEFTLSNKIMKHLIEATQFSMARQDVRYYLNGMLFETNGKELRTVATDGHRLAVCSIPVSNVLPTYSVILSRKGVIELMRMLDSSDDMLRVKIGNNSVRIYINNFIFTSKLIDGHFPNYHHVLLKNPSKKLEVNRDILRKAFTRVAVLSNERFRGVRLYINKNQIKITANNSEQEEAEEVLDVFYIGSEIEIAFNVTYILDVLNTLKCENVRILLTNSTSSIQIEDVSSRSVSYVIMPMRL